MKKLLTLLLLSLMTVSLLFANGAKESLSIDERVSTTRVVGLKGPTTIGMSKLIDDDKNGSVNGVDYEFVITGAPAEVTPMLVKADVDIAALPANLASVIFNNTNGSIQVLAVNTLGVLYLAENGDTVHSVEDLKGKTIYSSGKGSTPEYALMYVLEKAGLEVGKDVFVEWRSEHTECLSAIFTDKNAVAMLPEPFLSSARMTKDTIRVALDLNDAWSELSGGKMLITGVVVARKAFIEENPEAVEKFLTEYKASTEWVNANPEMAAPIVEELGIVNAKVATVAIPNCNIVCITGDELKSNLNNYLEVLFSQNPKAVGGKVPGAEFYY